MQDSGSEAEEDRKPAAITADTPMTEEGDGTASPMHHLNIKVKPALKKDNSKTKRNSSNNSPDSNNSSASNKKKQHDKHLKWDEQAIEEHDQLRGTRMKIDEPNTPYTHYDSGAESDDSRRPKSPAHQKQALSWDTLQTRLDSVAAVREQYPPSDSPLGEGEPSDEEERKKEMRKLEFKEHRKRHYNEFELVKRFRQEHAEDDDDAPTNDEDSNDNNEDGADDADDEAGNVSE